MRGSGLIALLTAAVGICPLASTMAALLRSSDMYGRRGHAWMKHMASRELD
jgi:hypothetical protein